MVKFTDNSIAIKNKLNDISIAFLEEAGGEVQSEAQRNTAVVTGQTKNSFKHRVDESNLECHIGSDYDNAIWEEFGTGIYAVNGDGRKKPWFWYDENGERHYTRGKKPKRMLFNAFNSLKSAIIKEAERRFKEL